MTRLEALRALHEAVKAGRDEDAMLTAFGIFPLAPITHINMILTPNDIRAMGSARVTIKRALEKAGFVHLRPGWVRKESAPRLQYKIDRAVAEAAGSVEQVKRGIAE